MISSNEFREHAHKFVDWMADYILNIEKFPVKSQLKPGEVKNQLPQYPPAKSESIGAIFQDFQDIVLPGITHWQSPSFFAYFPANSSYASLLAEMLTSTLGAQCMMWETSPAATELEEKVLDWLKQMIGLPDSFSGVIQDTASVSTLVSLLCAREKAANYKINNSGFQHNKFRIYCSSETHSSIEKAVKIGGFGIINLVKVEVNEDFSMKIQALEDAITKDIKNGYIPLAIIATLGTTGSTAIDSIPEIGNISEKYNLWLHVDAAFAGTALILEEYRWMIHGIENVDSFVFNPHKWMFTNFDCSVYYVKDKENLQATFTILPEYLKTKTQGKVNDYRDWGIQLGRRFRALKLWFVIRSYGVNGLKDKIRFHISLAEDFENIINSNEDFEVLARRKFNLVCFRFHPNGIDNQESLNTINEILLSAINNTGKIFLSHTKLNGNYTLRMVIGQTNVNKENVDAAWKLIQDEAKKL